MDKRALASGRGSSGVGTLQTWQTESWFFSLSLQPSYQHLSQCQLLSVLPFPLLQQNFALEGEEEKTSERWKKQKSEKKGEGPEWWLEKGKVHFGFTWLSNIRAGFLTENLSLTMFLVWTSPLATWAPHHLTGYEIFHILFSKSSRAWRKRKNKTEVTVEPSPKLKPTASNY